MRSVGARWALALIVLAAAAYGGVKLIDTGAKEPPPPAQAQPASALRSEIHALARLEPATGLITVGARPGIRIEKLFISEGDEVKAGQELVVLEGRNAAEIELERAELRKRQADEHRARQRAQLAVARQREDRVDKARGEMLQDIYSTLESRSESLKKVREDLAKIPQFSAKDKSDFDVAQDRLKAEAYKAYLELEQARADREAIAPSRKLEDRELDEGGSDEDKLLKRQIDLARASLDQMTIKAPRDGRVLQVTAHAGEVSSGALLLLGDVSTMVANAEVDQADLPSVEEGAPAQVTIQNTKVKGKVTRIGRVVGKNVLAGIDPRMPQDLRVARVTIRLDDPEPAAHFVSLQVDAAIYRKSAEGK
jgi:HlyD family secretion protein